jgi:WD40 repeat protein
VVALAAGPNGEWLAAASDDGTVRIWDPTTGTHQHTLKGHTSGVRALAAGPNGEWLASAGGDASVRIWDPTTDGTQSACLVGDENGWAALLSDGGYRMVGAPAGMWWAAGLCRFEPGEADDIAQYVPGLVRVGEDGPRDVVGG